MHSTYPREQYLGRRCIIARIEKEKETRSELGGKCFSGTLLCEPGREVETFRIRQGDGRGRFTKFHHSGCCDYMPRRGVLSRVFCTVGNLDRIETQRTEKVFLRMSSWSELGQTKKYNYSK